VIHPVTVNARVRSAFVLAILLLLTSSSLAVAQQPPPAPAQPGQPRPQQPGVPAQPQPGAPGQPPQPGQPPAPTTEETLPPTRTEREQPGSVIPEDPLQAEQPTITTPPTFLGPDLFNPPLHRGWLTLTPSLTISGEYNDNLFREEGNKVSDFSFGFIPGVTLSLQRPEYGLLAGYNVRSDLFVNETDLSGFANQHQLFADGFYRVGPRTRLTLSERFIYGEDATTISSDSAASGRENNWRNTIVLGVHHQLTEVTNLRASLAHNHHQFEGDPDAQNSDTFRLLLGADYAFTARLRGIAEFESGYLTIERESDAFTQRPRVGFDYQFTPTLSAGVLAGATVIFRDSETDIEPSATAQFAKLFKFGSLRGGYDYSVTAGTFGLSNRHSIFATLAFSQLVRNLVFDITPRYTMSDYEDGSNGASDRERQVDVLTINLRATYQLTAALALVGSYTFFHQNEKNGTNETIDQNRVFFGVQYAFPITFYR
jgi:predicted porin